MLTPILLASTESKPLGLPGDMVPGTASIVPVGGSFGCWSFSFEGPGRQGATSHFFSDVALHGVGESLRGSVEDRGWGCLLKVVRSVSRMLNCLLRGTEKVQNSTRY